MVRLLLGFLAVGVSTLIFNIFRIAQPNKESFKYVECCLCLRNLVESITLLLFHLPLGVCRRRLLNSILNDSSIFPGFRTLFRTDDSVLTFRMEVFFSLCLKIMFWSKLDSTISLVLAFTMLGWMSFWFCCNCCFILCRERILSCNTFCTSDSFSVGLTLLNFGMECTSDPLVLRKPLPLFQFTTNLQV